MSCTSIIFPSSNYFSSDFELFWYDEVFSNESLKKLVFLFETFHCSSCCKTLFVDCIDFLAHHFTWCHPFLDVIAEYCTDVDQDQQTAGHAEGQYRCFRGTGFYYCHSFIWNESKEMARQKVKLWSRVPIGLEHEPSDTHS